MSEAVTTAITAGCTAVAEGVTSGITTVLPLGMSVMALTMGIRITIGFFRSLAH